ncbi:hypothetical protein C8J57DRAFT_351283 [Mycena rebaudengoi]|nr:hypothetical protein C8J57DRAFT_351283 [Mycena rebaudengoi]
MRHEELLHTFRPSSSVRDCSMEESANVSALVLQNDSGRRQEYSERDRRVAMGFFIICLALHAANYVRNGPYSGRLSLIFSLLSLFCMMMIVLLSGVWYRLRSNLSTDKEHPTQFRTFAASWAILSLVLEGLASSPNSASIDTRLPPWGLVSMSMIIVLLGPASLYWLRCQAVFF